MNGTLTRWHENKPRRSQSGALGTTALAVFVLFGVHFRRSTASKHTEPRPGTFSVNSVRSVVLGLLRPRDDVVVRVDVAVAEGGEQAADRLEQRRRLQPGS